MARQTAEFRDPRPNPDHPGVQDVEPKEVWEQRENALLVDVRRPDEYDGELGHIAGARLMVLDTLPERLEELPKDRTIVFVCRSGGRSGRAAAFAKQSGYSDVYNMKGGMLRWNELKLEVERES